MGNEEMKKCPYCAEMVKSAAIKCRYCSSDLGEKQSVYDDLPSRGYWRRINEGKRVAGVCTGLAHELNSSRLILPLRLFFIVTTVLYGFGLIVYIVLWLLMPSPVDSVRIMKTETISSGINGNEPSESGYKKKIKPIDALLGFSLLAAGVILMLAAVGRSGFWGFPISANFGVWEYIHDPHTISFTWIPGIFPILIFLGLFLIFLGALKFFRIILGCCLIALGMVFLIILTPFLPKLLLFPGMLIIGIILMIIGGLKLAFGSTKVVKQEVSPQDEGDIIIK